MDSPYIVEETENYAVVFKPAKMHSENIAKDLSRRHGGTEDTERNESVSSIYDWYLKNVNFNENVKLMHRLDYETQGLVLFAKNEKSYLFFKDLQDKGEFIKEYSAVCVPSSKISTDHSLEGFPPCLSENSSLIQSYFRPFGPGRKQVRPVVEIPKKHKEIAKDKGGFYTTEIINIKDSDKTKIFTMRIKRGFRHQIRCHLCWIGFPILNDPLYSHAEQTGGTIPPESQLALKSHALFFADPANGERKECRIEGLGCALLNRQ